VNRGRRLPCFINPCSSLDGPPAQLLKVLLSAFICVICG
jgi:hypothetical protein